jgi:hypothetical protein|nr:MAG TPA: ENT domain protein [Caudoviricetes sp.]
MIRNRKINKMLNSYPCSDLLHMALRSIASGELIDAYCEICNVIMKSGGEITDAERKTWELMAKEREQK